MTDSDIAIIDTPELISRREAVFRITTIIGGVAVLGSGGLITACRREYKVGAPFTNDEVAYLDEIADTILPATSTPGAKAARTGAFMALMVRDTYHEDDDKVFRAGMGKLNDAMKDKYGKTFMEATPQQRLEMLQTLDREQHDYGEKQKSEAKRKSDEFLAERQQTPSPPQTVKATQIAEEPPNKYFRMMKELALLGYFTSEIGMTQAQRYTEAPGRYDPCVPYDGKPSWASHA
ncbi:MAG TPA: gluconate 2-dehydrogenase subunit 3 family protein [Gemmatimonadaceae bacterium]|nr:gluconate 2-dehydrogenase subunit 3 family protein [Gemmatimonadaceae bacterium]